MIIFTKSQIGPKSTSEEFDVIPELNARQITTVMFCAFIDNIVRDQSRGRIRRISLVIEQPVTELTTTHIIFIYA